MRAINFFIGDIQDIQIYFDEKVEKFRIYILYENADTTLILTPQRFVEFMDIIMGDSGYVNLISYLEDDVMNFYHMYMVITSGINYLVSPTKVKTLIRNDRLVEVLYGLIQSYVSNRFGEAKFINWCLSRDCDSVSFTIEPVEVR